MFISRILDILDIQSMASMEIPEQLSQATHKLLAIIALLSLAVGVLIVGAVCCIILMSELGTSRAMLHRRK